MVEEKKKKIKSMIEALINENKLEDAKLALEDYRKVVPDDIDIYSMLGVIYILENKVDDAKEALLEGLLKDEMNFDINYNLGYVAEMEQNFKNAYYFYNRALSSCRNIDIKNQINEKLNQLVLNNNELENYKREKIAFFCIKGLDNFLNDIIMHLSYDYEVKLVLVSNNEELKLVDKWMEWADICWFEWCNELAVYGSRLPIAMERKVICRLHRYEVFTNYIHQLNLENIDKIIFVSKYIKNLFLSKVNYDESKCEIVFNGINMKKFRKNLDMNKGFNIAWIGYLNLRKNPMMAIQILYELIKIDKRYKLFIAGSFQDEALKDYIITLIKKLNLEGHVFFNDFIPNEKINEWLKDKNYIISTSISEGHPVGIMEAMMCGLKPIIHYFPGIEEFYPEKFIWYTIDEAVEMILSDDYNSTEYRHFIENRYSLIKQITEIKNVLNRISFNKEKEVILNLKHILDKKVNFENIDDLTIIIPTYNRANLLKEDLTYGHKLGNQNKIIVDDCSNIENKNILNNLLINRKNYGIEKIIFNDINKGVALSIGIGIKNVKTKYMTLCDDDDKLFCLNKDELKCSINKLNDDCLMIIPRYVINLDSYDNITIGYDRKKFDNKLACEILEKFFKTGEIEGLAAGLITNADLSRECLPEDIFKVSEDYVLLSRLLANNQNKKIKVLDSYIYLRRINDSTLSKTINIEKLSIHLLSMLVSGFYSLKFNIITRDELFIYLNKRAEIIQNIYGFGIEYINLIFDCLTKKINLDEFININKNRYIKQMDFKNIPKEIIELIKLL